MIDSRPMSDDQQRRRDLRNGRRAIRLLAFLLEERKSDPKGWVIARDPGDRGRRCDPTDRLLEDRVHHPMEPELAEELRETRAYFERAAAEMAESEPPQEEESR
jgi:hypothetical protein